MTNLLYVAIGGALGAVLRYQLAVWMVLLFGKEFPYATLLVNVIGSFALGLLFSLMEHGIIADIPWRTLVGIGLLGAFTTFSTFSLDTVLLFQQGATIKALVNVFLNVITCLVGVFAAMQLVNKII